MTIVPIVVDLIEVPEPDALPQIIGQVDPNDIPPKALYYQLAGENGLRIYVDGRSLLLPYAALVDAVETALITAPRKVA